MEKSDFSYHAPCSECQSKDNVAVYTDGHGHCFGCGHYYHTYEQKEETKLETELIHGELKPLNKRHIDLATTTKFNYQTGKYNGKTVQIANYYDKHNKLVAQKLRYPDKSFQWLGDSKQATLFGQNLWRDTNKKIVILEGEIDSMSMAQAQGLKWACVSVKTGSQGAKKDLQQQLEWLEQASEIVLMFDSDEAGKKAAQECSKLFTPGKCKIATLPRKDANDMLVQGETAKLIDCMWGAKTYRPDGIVSGTEVFDLISKEDKTETVPYPFDCLNKKTLGMRRGELVTITSGTGQGKSQLCRQIAHHLLKHGESVGYIALEESVKRSALGIMGIDLQRPLHLSKDNVNKEEFKKSFDSTVGSGLFYMFDHFGSTQSDNLLSKIQYLAKGLNVKWIILDHLSIVISGLESFDERKLIDVTMTKLRSLVESTGIGLFVVNHLRRPEGNKGYEDGLQTSLNSLRGSAAISQLSDGVISLEKNQQDDENKNYTTIRVLKNRHTGDTGKCGTLYFDNDTACLTEITEGHEKDF